MPYKFCMNKSPKTVTIRGTTYATPQEAADALGVGYKTIIAARLRNRLDYVGLGVGKSPKAEPELKRLSEGINSKAVIIRGVEYPSMSIAADVLDVSVQTISRAAKTGRLETVGLRIFGRPPKDDY